MTQQPSVYLDETPLLLQESVYQLEDYKRRLGRNFDRATDHHSRVWYFNKYNHTENLIRELCDRYNLRRKYEPHKLDINKV